MTQTLQPATSVAPAFETPAEQDCRLGPVEGLLPSYVRGAFFLNGPARFERSGLRYRHWLDGDGMVAALRFEGDQVSFRSRFVRSAKWVAEEDAGHPVFRTFGTSFDGDRLVRGMVLESPVNVSVFPVAGKLLAFGEQGLPYELDKDTLETRGVFDFHRAVNPVTPFAAHAKIDESTGEFFNFGISFSPRRPSLHFYRFDSNLDLSQRARIDLDAPRSLHDFGLSRNYAVFYLSPYVLDMGKLRRAGCSLLRALDWVPEWGSRLLVLSRRTGRQVARVDVGHRFSLHIANCFEQDGRLVVDTTEYERPLYEQYEGVPELFTSVDSGRPVRLEIDLEQERLADRCSVDYRGAPDFPCIDPRQAMEGASCCWMLGMSAAGQPGPKFFDQLIRIDWETGRAAQIYQAPPGQYLGGEPAFIPDPLNPEAGSVICQTYCPQKRQSSFLLFDAYDLESGPRAAVSLPQPMHFCFHTCFEQAGGR